MPRETTPTPCVADTVGEVTRKTCTRCHQHKPHAAFDRDARRRDGLRALCRECRAAQRQEAVSLKAPDEVLCLDPVLRQQRIDLGLAVAQATCPPGHCRTLEEIAAYTGLTREAVRQIEQRALAKLRAAALRLLAREEVKDVRRWGI